MIKPANRHLSCVPWASSRLLGSVLFSGWLVSLFTMAETQGQSIGVTTPFTSASGGYFESTGMNWSFGLPRQGGVFGLGPGGQLMPQVGFSWGGGNVVPPFGGYSPNSGGQLNVTGNNFSLGFNFAKGSSRTLTSQAPSMIVQNGSGGSFFSGQVSPFVIGMVPIIGDQPLDNAVTRAVQSGQLDLTYRPEDSPSDLEREFHYYGKSSANAGDQSIAAIKNQRKLQQSKQQQQLQGLLAESKKLIETGRPSMARQKLRQALELTQDEELKKVIRTQIDNLRPSLRK